MLDEFQATMVAVWQGKHKHLVLGAGGVGWLMDC